MHSTHTEKLPYTMTQDELEAFYDTFVLPKFNIVGRNSWLKHMQTDIDSSLHVFTAAGGVYALAYDDYNNGFSDLEDKTNFAEPKKTLEETDRLKVSPSVDTFTNDVVGEFKLFKITDESKFTAHTELLAKDFEMMRGGPQIDIARDIILLAEQASLNKDAESLGAILRLTRILEDRSVHDSTIDTSTLQEYLLGLMDDENCPGYDAAHIKNLRDDIYRMLASKGQYIVNKTKYKAKRLGSMLTLVSALYGRKLDGKTNGTSIVFTVQDSTVNFPLKDQPLNAKLAEYFELHPYINELNVEMHLPEFLGEYKLIAGGTEVQKIFSDELEYISF